MIINGNKVKLNNTIEVIYLNKSQHQEITLGRVFDFNRKYLYLDCSNDYMSLDNIVKIKIKNIQNIRIINTNYWRI